MTYLSITENLFDVAHAPFLFPCNRGFYACWHGKQEKSDNNGIWLSEYSDHWQKPRLIASHSLDCWNPVLIYTGNQLVLFYKIGTHPPRWKGCYITSQDQGHTWGSHTMLPEGFIGPARSAPLPLGSNSLLCGSSREKGGKRVVRFETINLEQLTEQWSISQPDNENPYLQAIQPSLLCQSDNHLVALCRSNQGCLLSASSIDNGVSWSELLPTKLKHPNSGFSAISIVQGGYLVAFSHHKRNSNRLYLAWSFDAITWRVFYRLAEDDKQLLYPSLAQNDNGDLLVAFSVNQQSIAFQKICSERLTSLICSDHNL